VNFSRRFQLCFLLALATLMLTLLSGCNLFSPLSSPSGDDQILSAARAKFDSGDFQGAIALYNQLSSADQDIALSETAYAQLAEQNASMPNYMAAFGKGNVAIGPAITKFAEGMIVGAGESRRVAIYNAYLNYNQLLTIGSPNLAYLVEFLGALSFAAEILAEEGSYDQNGNPILTQNDLNTLQLTGTPAPGTALSGLTLNQVSVSPGTYDLFNAAVLEISKAVVNLGTNGSFSNSTIAFAGASGFQAPPGSTSQYVQNVLIPAGIGEANQ
jgi:hypothetical protein